MTQFRNLNVGDTFDFIHDDKPMFNSYYNRCVKLSARTYTAIEGEALHIMRVGSINAEVFHVEQKVA